MCDDVERLSGIEVVANNFMVGEFEEEARKSHQKHWKHFWKGVKKGTCI